MRSVPLVVVLIVCTLSLGIAAIADESEALDDLVQDRHYDVTIKPGESFRSEYSVAGRLDAASWDFEHVAIIDADGCTYLQISKERNNNSTGDVYYLTGVIETAGTYDVHVQSKAWIEADSRYVINNSYFHFTVTSEGSSGTTETYPCTLVLDAENSGHWELVENFTFENELSVHATADFDLSSHYPVKDGYEFKGWAESSGGPVVAANSYCVDVYITNGVVDLKGYSRTLYAVFSEIYVPEGKCLLTVYFDTCGGSAVPAMNYYAESMESHTFDLSGRSCERSGFDFKGWSLSDGGSRVSSVTINGVESGSSNIIVYALWSESSSAGVKDFLGDLGGVIGDPVTILVILAFVFGFAFVVRSRNGGYR